MSRLSLLPWERPGDPPSKSQTLSQFNFCEIALANDQPRSLGLSSNPVPSEASEERLQRAVKWETLGTRLANDSQACPESAGPVLADSKCQGYVRTLWQKYCCCFWRLYSWQPQPSPGISGFMSAAPHHMPFCSQSMPLTNLSTFCDSSSGLPCLQANDLIPRDPFLHPFCSSFNHSFPGGG